MNFVFLSEYIQAYVVQLLVHVSQKFLVRILVLRALRPFRSQVISAFLRFPPLCIRIYPSAAGDSQVSFARDELEIAAEEEALSSADRRSRLLINIIGTVHGPEKYVMF